MWARASKQEIFQSVSTVFLDELIVLKKCHCKYHLHVNVYTKRLQQTVNFSLQECSFRQWLMKYWTHTQLNVAVVPCATTTHGRSDSPTSHPPSLWCSWSHSPCFSARLHRLPFILLRPLPHLLSSSIPLFPLFFFHSLFLALCPYNGLPPSFSLSPSLSLTSLYTPSLSFFFFVYTGHSHTFRKCVCVCVRVRACVHVW